MIYFKDIKSLEAFIVNHLMNYSRSKDWYGMFGMTPIIYLKNSSKEFQSIAEVIEELKKLQLVLEITEYERDYQSNPKVLGYILYYSQLQRYINSEEDYLNFNLNSLRLLSISQTCEILHISRPTLYKLIKTGKISPVEIFGKKRIQVAEIMNFISQQKDR